MPLTGTREPRVGLKLGVDELKRQSRWLVNCSQRHVGNVTITLVLCLVIHQKLNYLITRTTMLHIQGITISYSNSLPTLDDSVTLVTLKKKTFWPLCSSTFSNSSSKPLDLSYNSNCHGTITSIDARLVTSDGKLMLQGLVSYAILCNWPHRWWKGWGYEAPAPPDFKGCSKGF